MRLQVLVVADIHIVYCRWWTVLGVESRLNRAFPRLSVTVADQNNSNVATGDCAATASLHPYLRRKRPQVLESKRPRKSELTRSGELLPVPELLSDGDRETRRVGPPNEATEGSAISKFSDSYVVLAAVLDHIRGRHRKYD